MIFLILILVVLGLIYFLPRRVLPEKDHKYHAGVATLQAILAILVVTVGAYWYFVERKGTAHANLTLSATGVKLTPNTVLVHARVQIDNTGYILLEPGQWEVRLLSVVPPEPTPVEEAAIAAQDHVDQWPAQLNGQQAYYENELQWGALRQFSGQVGHQIEPGERDVRTFDMLVPCEIQTAKFTVALRKPWIFWTQGFEPEGGLWWRERMMFSLGSLCRGPVGVVRTLGPETGAVAEQPPEQPLREGGTPCTSEECG